MNLNSIVQQLQSERQQQANGVSAKAATTNAAAASSSTAGDTGDATITADDFLTLLVTELQNQDPTSDTDPNAYVNQLVDVNSLQQLISINSGIGTLDSSVDVDGDYGNDGNRQLFGRSGFGHEWDLLCSFRPGLAGAGKQRAGQLWRLWLIAVVRS